MHPNESRFFAENFGDCPVIFIEQALDAANSRDLELANYFAVPLSYVGVGLVSAQGVKDVNPQWFNPYEKILESKAAKEFLSLECVNIFHQLKDEGKLPNWTINQFNLELLDNLKN